MVKLILLRHFLSQWNRENKFSGWTDVPLSEEGMATASIQAAKLPVVPDIVFTSPLSRNKTTAWLILDELGKQSVFLKPGEEPADTFDVPVYTTEALNERSYGLLEGVNKDDAKRDYGEKQLQLWRRSWDVAPPEGESLEDVYHRIVPFFQDYIEPKLTLGLDILIVGSHNSLRALAKYLEKISDEDITDYEIPFGGMIIYDLDDKLSMVKKEIK
ncbi:MAG: 2,3-diphosphoglycerate-dependent phosphoglycerate mutase [Candidatus Paceibacterota bacterium]|jgi:2,3-bisphosphoglycerate-dependent phosphoglycerate mutase